MPRTFIHHPDAPSLEREFVDLWRTVDRLARKAEISITQVIESPGQTDTTVVNSSGSGDVRVMPILFEGPVSGAGPGRNLFGTDIRFVMEQGAMMQIHRVDLHLLSATTDPFDFFVEIQGSNCELIALVDLPFHSPARPRYLMHQVCQKRNVHAPGHYSMVPTGGRYDPDAYSIVDHYDISRDRTSLGFPYKPAEVGQGFRDIVLKVLGWIREDTPRTQCFQALVEIVWVPMERSRYESGLCGVA